MTPKKSAFVGFLFVLPFVIVNFIVSLRLEPFYSFIGSFPAIRNSPLIPLILLLLFPVGAFIAIRPMLQREPDGTRRIYWVNAVLAFVINIIFLLLFYALGEEFYRCEILKIPDCD